MRQYFLAPRSQRSCQRVISVVPHDYLLRSTDLLVCRHSIHEAHHTWQDTYAESFNQPRYIFHKNANEKRREVLGCQDLYLHAISHTRRAFNENRETHSQMLIHNLAPFEIAMEEMNHTAGFVAACMFQRQPLDASVVD